MCVCLYSRASNNKTKKKRRTMITITQTHITDAKNEGAFGKVGLILGAAIVDFKTFKLKKRRLIVWAIFIDQKC